MKPLLVTGYDAPYAELASLTIPRMAEYARQTGMDFFIRTSPPLDVPNGIYWTGVCEMIDGLKRKHPYVMYLDIDQAVTNFDFRHPCTNGFNASLDWGKDAVSPEQFSMCGVVAFPDCLPILKSVLAQEPEWRERAFPEQAPMQNAMKKNPKGFNVFPRRVFNAVPESVCPGEIPEPWQEGDFCAHLTMIPIKDRVRLAKELL